MRREQIFEDKAVFNRRIVDIPPCEFDAAVTAVFDDSLADRAEHVITSNESVITSDESVTHDESIVADDESVTDGEPLVADHETVANDAPVIADDEPAANADDMGILHSGERLRGRYEIVEHVYSGGMSHVYKAVDLRRQWNGSESEFVAIKTMRNPLVDGVDDRTLEQEATKTMQLSHPNVVTIHDYDQHEDQFFIVMEWLFGESLNDLLRRTQGRHLVPEFADRIIEGVVRGLQHAHQRNIVHADLNPSNVFITDVQEVKILDFGVARYADDAETTAEVSEVWATFHYASPQVLSRLTPTRADDVFALACLIYRLKTGRLPFMGLSSRAAWKNGDEVMPLSTAWNAALDPVLDGLAYERAKRPRDVAAFASRWTMEKSIDRALRPLRNRVSESNWLRALQQRTR
ncbi:MAG: serine/threonine-protein kinase [Pseudomonadota bacterium]